MTVSQPDSVTALPVSTLCLLKLFSWSSFVVAAELCPQSFPLPALRRAARCRLMKHRTASWHSGQKQTNSLMETGSSVFALQLMFPLNARTPSGPVLSWSDLQPCDPAPIMWFVRYKQFGSFPLQRCFCEQSIGSTVQSWSCWEKVSCGLVCSCRLWSVLFRPSRTTHNHPQPLLHPLFPLSGLKMKDAPHFCSLSEIMKLLFW